MPKKKARKKKKTVKKKTKSKKKKVVKKSRRKKPAKKKTVKKKTRAKAPKKPKMKKAVNPALLPPSVDGTLLGRVEDYFAHIGVIALTLGAPLQIGDTIRVKGHTTDLTQPVASMQIDHMAVTSANKKDSVGIKLSDRARRHDWVFRIP